MVDSRKFATLLSHRVLVIWFALIALSVIFGGCKKKETVPANVVGGSMAPNVLGKCLQAQCVDCAITFCCDIDQANKRKELVCPNCGCQSIPRQTAVVRDSNLFDVELENSELSRWDIVALKQPESTKTAIKRIVGLPGETITIRDGNLFLDKQLIRKTVQQQKQMMIAVHDSQFTTDHRKRWLSRQAVRELAPTSELPILKPVNLDVELDWKFYRHFKCYSHRDRDGEALPPIEDSYGYNQTLARNLNPIDELFFRATVDCTLQSYVGLRFDFRSEVFEFVIDCRRRQLTCASTGATVFDLTTPLEATIPPNWSGADLKIELSTIDLQLNLIVNGILVCRAELPEETPYQVSICPLAIGLDGPETKIKRLQIWRDIYYLPAGANSASEQTLTGTADGFLLLGDNVPLSLDSRQWKPVGVRRQDILGVVKTKASQ